MYIHINLIQKQSEDRAAAQTSRSEAGTLRHIQPLLPLGVVKETVGAAVSPLINLLATK